MAANRDKSHEISDLESSGDFVTGLARGLEVLGVCAANPAGLPLAEIARRTNLPRAAARRSLLTLVATGYVAQNERNFLPTFKVLSLSSRIADMPLPRLAQPILDRLSQDLDESASVATLDHTEVLYVVRSESRRILSVDLAVGSRLPAWCTSMGRVLLAALPADQRNAHIPEHLAAQSPRTITDRGELDRIFEQIRADGHCILDQELEAGLRSVAAPIMRHGVVVAALNVSTQTARTSLRDVRRVILPQTIAAATALGELLGQQ